MATYCLQHWSCWYSIELSAVVILLDWKTYVLLKKWLISVLSLRSSFKIEIYFFEALAIVATKRSCRCVTSFGGINQKIRQWNAAINHKVLKVLFPALESVGIYPIRYNYKHNQICISPRSNRPKERRHHRSVRGNLLQKTIINQITGLRSNNRYVLNNLLSFTAFERTVNTRGIKLVIFWLQ